MQRVNGSVARPGAAGYPPTPGAHSLLTESEFSRLAVRVMQISGIVLPPHKRQLVASRLRKRLKALGLSDFGAYLAYLDSPDSASETGELINVITTNVTAFFREGHHFDDLAGVLSDPGAGGGSGPRRIRIWSAACSIGEEPYTIAMTALNARIGSPGSDLRILATDLDTEALEWARAGVYTAERVEPCPPEYRRKYFEPQPDGRLRVCTAARSLVTFNQLNLHDAWPMRGPFDVIFCRNVLIYFDAAAKAEIVDRFTSMLQPGGTLYLGHSESMLGNHPDLVNHGRTIFRKCA